MSEHIPTPWTASQYLDDGRWGIVNNDNFIVVGLSSNTTKENIEFIVTAVNNYDRLIHEREELITELEQFLDAALKGKTFFDSPGGCIDRSRELLQRAKGNP